MWIVKLFQNYLNENMEKTLNELDKILLDNNNFVVFDTLNNKVGRNFEKDQKPRMPRIVTLRVKLIPEVVDVNPTCTLTFRDFMMAEPMVTSSPIYHNPERYNKDYINDSRYKRILGYYTGTGSTDTQGYFTGRKIDEGFEIQFQGMVPLELAGKGIVFGCEFLYTTSDIHHSIFIGDDYERTMVAHNTDIGDTKLSIYYPYGAYFVPGTHPRNIEQVYFGVCNNESPAEGENRSMWIYTKKEMFFKSVRSVCIMLQKRSGFVDISKLSGINVLPPLGGIFDDGKGIKFWNVPEDAGSLDDFIRKGGATIVLQPKETTQVIGEHEPDPGPKPKHSMLYESYSYELVPNIEDTYDINFKLVREGE